jgi:hypothetical protein
MEQKTVGSKQIILEIKAVVLSIEVELGKGPDDKRWANRNASKTNHKPILAQIGQHNK